VVLAVSYRLVSVWVHEAPAPDDDPLAVAEALTDHDETPH